MTTKLILEQTEDTPGVIFDPENDRFEIFGKSLPENATEFYGKLIDYLEMYALEPNKKTKLVLNFKYYNSSTIRKILNILSILEEMHLDGDEVSAVWMYEETDELTKENGEDFKDNLNIPFEIKSFKLDY